MQEEWGHEVAAEALPAEEGVAIEGEVLEAVPVYAEEGMKEMISQEEEEAPGTVVFEYREDDGGRWHPYDEATCQRLEHASRQGDARVSLPGRRHITDGPPPPWPHTPSGSPAAALNPTPSIKLRKYPGGPQPQEAPGGRS